MIQKSDFKAEVRRRVEASGVPVEMWNELVDARMAMYAAGKALREIDGQRKAWEPCQTASVVARIDHVSERLRIRMRDVMGIDFIEKANDGIPEKEQYRLADIRL